LIGALDAGVPVVVAIGNEGSQTSGSPGNDFFAFTVGATDSQDLAAGFSGGRTQIVESSRYINPKNLPFVYSKPDVSAPGVEILSAVPGGKYEAWNGTSMATPHVAGAMALLLSENRSIREVDGRDRSQLLKDLLVSTVQPLGESGQNHRFGFGRINALRAMGLAIDLGY
jgi:subtilisin family serine protease